MTRITAAVLAAFLLAGSAWAQTVFLAPTQLPCGKSADIIAMLEGKFLERPVMQGATESGFSCAALEK